MMLWMGWYRLWFDLIMGAAPVQVRYRDNVIYVDFTRKERQ